MAHRYSEFGYDGCSCLEPDIQYCSICGSRCDHDADLCDTHADEAHEDLQTEINYQLDELGEFVIAL
jgi:hypothetical protein